MVLMVRSFRSTMKLLQWVSFSIIILLSMFAIYCVESKASFSNDVTVYQKRHYIIDSTQKDKDTTPSPGQGLLPTNLVLVSTLDGSIRGVDRYEGRVHWTLKGGPGSSLIKSNSHFETHRLYKPGPTSVNSKHAQQQDKQQVLKEQEFVVVEEDDDDDFNLFQDSLSGEFTSSTDTEGDSDSADDEFDDFNFERFPWEDSEAEEENVEDADIYYIIEPQDGGSLYIYGDGRPLEVKKKVDN